jgi:hypothetical protein
MPPLFSVYAQETFFKDTQHEVSKGNLMSITVENAKIEKEEMEQQIFELLREFEQKTGFHTDYMNIDREERMEKSVITGVLLTCYLK